MTSPRMRLAVLSDVHGFSLALDRVLADIQAAGDIDAIVVAGDMCEGGPDPRGVYERLSRMNVYTLKGNTDRDIAEGTRTSQLGKYVTRALGSDGRAWLASRPFSQRFSPPGDHPRSADVLVVHANPFDMDRAIRPDADDVAIRQLIGATEAAVIAFGHIHIAYSRTYHNTTLLDVSSVGCSRDGDISSRWGLIEWNDTEQHWESEIRKVEYPIEETIEQMLTSGMPNPDKHIRKLLKARY